MVRRQILVLGLAILLAPTLATPAAAQVRTQAPGFYRIMLGVFEVTVLSDGTAPRPVDKLMSKPHEIREILTRDPVLIGRHTGL